MWLIALQSRGNTLIVPKNFESFFWRLCWEMHFNWNPQMNSISKINHSTKQRSSWNDLPLLFSALCKSISNRYKLWSGALWRCRCHCRNLISVANQSSKLNKCDCNLIFAKQNRWENQHCAKARHIGRFLSLHRFARMNAHTITVTINVIPSDRYKPKIILKRKMTYDVVAWLPACLTGWRESFWCHNASQRHSVQNQWQQKSWHRV